MDTQTLNVQRASEPLFYKTRTAEEITMDEIRLDLSSDPISRLQQTLDNLIRRNILQNSERRKYRAESDLRAACDRAIARNKEEQGVVMDAMSLYQW